jgi:poly-gamma-glutamate capsule biosynthesis protein CapA/YwtB (metallophosphatase superfamily)
VIPVPFQNGLNWSEIDIVIGAHPHWIQLIETYKGKLIFYSLGNFIFDQRKPGTQEGLALKIAVRKTVQGAGGYRSHRSDPGHH